MKKSDLVHVTILIVAVLSGYNAIGAVITLLASIAYYIEGLYRATEVYIVFYLIQAVLYSLACIVLIRNGRKYADQMTQNEAEDFVEDAPRWDLDRRNMLYVLFIGLGLYLVIQSATVAADTLYQNFKAKVGAMDLIEKGPRQTTTLLVDLLRLTAGACLIYAAPNLTNLIENSISVRLDGDKQSS
jgi:hypothetical protein